MAYVLKRACLKRTGSMTITVAPAEQHPLRFTKLDGASVEDLVAGLAEGEYIPQRAARIGGINLYDLAKRIKAEPDPVAAGIGWIHAGAIPEATAVVRASEPDITVFVTGTEEAPVKAAEPDITVSATGTREQKAAVRAVEAERVKAMETPVAATRPAHGGILCHGANIGRSGCLAMMEDVPGRPRVRRFASLRAFLSQLRSGTIVPTNGAMLQTLRMEDVAAAMNKAGDAAVEIAEVWVRDGVIKEPVPKPSGLVRGRIHVSFCDLLTEEVVEWLNDLASEALTGSTAGLTDISFVPRAVHNGQIAIDVEGIRCDECDDELGDDGANAVC